MKIKGFTLIELLAVIVILAILALIATPIILNILGDTKINAVKRSAENYIDAVELYLVGSELDNNKVTLERNNKYNVTNSTYIEEKNYPATNDLVEMSGSKPAGVDDYIQINDKGQVTDAKLTMGGYEIELKDGKIVSVKGGLDVVPESMILNLTEQTMEKGSTFKINVTFKPSNTSNQEVIYESNNTDIVTVDELGNVSAKEVGTAKIIVTSKENPNIKAECNIEVVISATGLKIYSDSTDVDVGKSLQLTGTITPTNATTNSLTWKSSNADIASVDSNGLVTGISTGEVEITATTVNGIEDKINIIVYPFVEEPDLYNTLIPVVYKNNNWVVADTTTRWYNYSKQEWANAVILKNGITKTIGDTVDVSTEVQGMFVWIPKYEYKIEGQYGTHTDGTLGTEEQPGEIKVNFISKNKITANSGFIMHPAFTFGSTSLSGIWVGKFETTGSASNPTVLPNNVSLTDQSVSEQFATAQRFNTYLNNTDIDTHMSKNSEWGAVAYLSQSKYGKFGNSKYVGADKQIMFNNCSTMLTGIGANAQNEADSSIICTTNTYETDKGQAASTTGNITGIYDMNGGTWEYVMAVLNNAVSMSGFSKMPDSKYYNNYTSLNANTACNGGTCYGQALGETSNWYNDSAIFLTEENPWLVRGGRYDDGTYGYGITTGIFSYSYSFSAGDKNNTYSFRMSITKS